MNGKTDLHNPEELLKRSSELASILEEFLQLPPYSTSSRIVSSHTLCAVSFEHAESVRILTATGNFTSSLGVLRMQYEALVKAFWTLYAASDEAVDKLQAELTHTSAKAADKVPTAPRKPSFPFDIAIDTRPALIASHMPNLREIMRENAVDQPKLTLSQGVAQFSVPVLKHKQQTTLLPVLLDFGTPENIRNVTISYEIHAHEMLEPVHQQLHLKLAA